MKSMLRLKLVLFQLGQKPKAKNHVLVFDSDDLKAFNEGKAGIHAYYSNAGKKLGYATRKSLRKLNLVSKAAHVFVFNDQGELFLQKRASSKDVYPGLIAPSASGHVDLNETPKGAAVRELQEELGIKENPVFLGKVKCFSPVLKEFLHVFMAITNQKITINKEEISEGFFKPFSQVCKNPNSLEYIPAMQKELLKFKAKIVKNLKKYRIKQ